MRNSAIVLLVIAVGILGVLAYSESVTLRQERRQLQDLTAKFSSAPRNASLELQGKCAKQAQEYISQFENRDLVDERNHFNVGLNKCFVETRSVSVVLGNRSVSRELTDAFEGKEYGSYIFVSKPNKADWQVPPVECEVLLPSGDEKICHSEDEFDALVKQYME